MTDFETAIMIKNVVRETVKRMTAKNVKNATPRETVAMRELLDAADLFATRGNAQAAMACQVAKTKTDVEKIIAKYGSNFRLQNALKYLD